MNLSNRRPTLPLLLATALLLLGALQPAASAQVSDTTWVVDAKATLKLKGSPQNKLTQKVKGPALLRFLTGGDFQIEDIAGYSIGGDWSEAGDALQVMVDTQDIVDFLDDNLGGLAAQLEDLQVDDLASDAKLVTKKNGVSSLTYKLKFTLGFTVDGDAVTLTYKLSAKGQFDLTGASAGGETFAFDGKQTFKAPGTKLKTAAGLQLVLGPDGGLAGDRFSLRDGVGSELFGGWYSRVGGKFTLLPEATGVEDHVEAWIAPTVQQLFPGGVVSLELVATKFTGTVKKNGALKLKGKSTFFSVLDAGPDFEIFKSTYALGS